MPRDLPSGTVTFLFTDIEGATSLLHELGPVGYAAAQAEHRRFCALPSAPTAQPTARMSACHADPSAFPKS